MTTKESIDRHGETHIVSATCGLCHTVHDKVPVNPPKCAGCGATGCDQCDHHMAIFTCDVCDEPVCKDCIRSVNGYVVCLKVACKDRAKEEQKEIAVATAERKKEEVPSWRRAS